MVLFKALLILQTSFLLQMNHQKRCKAPELCTIARIPRKDSKSYFSIFHPVQRWKLIETFEWMSSDREKFSDPFAGWRKTKRAVSCFFLLVFRGCKLFESRRTNLSYIGPLYRLVIMLNSARVRSTGGPNRSTQIRIRRQGHWSGETFQLPPSNASLMKSTSSPGTMAPLSNEKIRSGCRSAALKSSRANAVPLRHQQICAFCSSASEKRRQEGKQGRVHGLAPTKRREIGSGRPQGGGDAESRDRSSAGAALKGARLKAGHGIRSASLRCSPYRHPALSVFLSAFRPAPFSLLLTVECFSIPRCPRNPAFPISGKHRFLEISKATSFDVDKKWTIRQETWNFFKNRRQGLSHILPDPEELRLTLSLKRGQLEIDVWTVVNSRSLNSVTSRSRLWLVSFLSGASW